MQTFEDILEAARRLPEAERRRLVEALSDDGGKETSGVRKRKVALERFLAMAGTVHADITDLSENKNKYLADIYATKP